MPISDFTKRTLALAEPKKGVSLFTQSAVDSYDIVFEKPKVTIPSKPVLDYNLKISQSPSTIISRIDKFLEPLRSRLEGITFIGRRPLREVADEDSLINISNELSRQKLSGKKLNSEELELLKQGQKLSIARYADMVINFAGPMKISRGKLVEVVRNTKTTQRANEILGKLGIDDEARVILRPEIIKANTKQEALDFIVNRLEKYSKPTPVLKALPQVQKATAIGSRIDDISKAKASGQSFDEWVKGQGKSVYRGEYTRKQELNNAISTSLDKSVAKSFSENGKIS